ncbi:hypothetical protein EU803_03745 [Loktanella sp. IMCC34160]|uniref:hypothetical protein n=1 Tax=Loktanella sp. IMCC34160 TaxID=2510646 RepID=UPI00101C454D|nr:hypothetical protein [Loktanella sp. IMCC34160]RYG93226.1 hypothetical protein EU803_03745 [Loktanella sp. IMCC34160]
MQYDQFHPNSCPSCGTRPYPWGKACETCGLVGEERVGPAWMPRLAPVAASLFVILVIMAVIGAVFSAG